MKYTFKIKETKIKEITIDASNFQEAVTVFTNIPKPDNLINIEIVDIKEKNDYDFGPEDYMDQSGAQ